MRWVFVNGPASFRWKMAGSVSEMGVQAIEPEREMNLSTSFPTAMQVATPTKEIKVRDKFFKYVRVLLWGIFAKT